MHNESTLASDNLSKGKGVSAAVNTSPVSGPSASDGSSRTITTETLPTIGYGLDQTQDSVGLPSKEMLVDMALLSVNPVMTYLVLCNFQILIPMVIMYQVRKVETS